MSTIKADAITAVSTNGDLSLDGLGTGGVSIASTLKMNKGGDIASASPLVIDTDGNYFDVTGTTSFAAMTVEAGNFFMLQFDGALTITHGSGIELPNATNLTTATGDRLMCYATAADTVEVMSVELETAVSAAFTIATEQAVTSGTGVTFSSIPSGTKQIHIMFHEVSTSTTVANNAILVQLGDAGGLETSGYLTSGGSCHNGYWYSDFYTAGFGLFTRSGISASDQNISGVMSFYLEDAANFSWVSSGSYKQDHANADANVANSGGSKSLSAELTQLKVGMEGSGTYDAGAISIMYM